MDGMNPSELLLLTLQQKDRIKRLQEQLADAHKVVDDLHRILETRPGEDITLVAARRMRQARRPRPTAVTGTTPPHWPNLTAED